MARLFIHISLFLVLLNSSSGGQLFKIPLLFSHYVEHQDKNAGISLVSFLSMHYLGGEKHDEDHDRDMQLPFKSAEHNCYFQFTSLPSPVIVIEKQHSYVLKNELPPLQISFLKDPTLSSLFRPPKI